MSKHAVPVGYKQTEVGVIPEDWDVKRLKEISPSQSVGLVINPSSYYSNRGTVPMLVGSHIYENQIKWSTANRTTAESNSRLPASRLNQGDLVTVRVGDPGVTAVIPPELDQSNCASMMIIRQGKEFDSYWLCFLLNSKIGRSQIEGVQYGTAQKQFNIVDAVDFLFPFPSKNEQTAIANALSDVDTLISELEKLITKKQAIKTATMQQLLTGRTRLPQFALREDGSKKGNKQSELGEIPEDWEVVAMGQLGYFGRGRVISHKEINRSISKQYPVYSSQTFNEGIMGYLDSFDFDGEYVTWTTDGVNAGKVFYRNGKFNCTNVCGVISIKSESAKFVAIAMGAEARKYVSTNLANPKLMNGEAKKVLIKKPINIEEQIAIATILIDMDEELQLLEQRLSKTRQIKQGIMQELLTGKTRLVKPKDDHHGSA